MNKIIDSYKYLDLARDIKANHTFYDVHVHPHEIFYLDDTEIQNSPVKQSKVGLVYSSYNKITNIVLKEKKSAIDKMFDRPDIQKKRIVEMYREGSSETLINSMRISLVDRAVLLPIATAENDFNTQLHALHNKYGNQASFLLGTSVPPELQDSEMPGHLHSAKKKYNVKAIKVHPNVSAIDLNTDAGVKRVESILESADMVRLPVIIHGGKSSGYMLSNPEAAGYSVIKNLTKIEYGISKHPVIIAHAGAYLYSRNEIENDIITGLEKLIDQNDNLYVDISGLDIEQLAPVVENISVEKILFGSDALYHKQWVGIVYLLYALSVVHKNYQESFLKIVSTNPAGVFEPNSGQI